MKKLIKRLNAKTPAFFNRVKIIGGSLVAVSAAIMSGGVAVPAVIATYAGYFATVGATMVAVSQLVVHDEK